MYLGLLLDLSGLLLDGILHGIIGGAQLCHQGLLQLVVFLNLICPGVEAFLTHGVEQVGDGDVIGMLGFLQKESESLRAVQHLVGGIYRHVGLALGNALAYLCIEVGKENTHLRQVVLQVAGDAVVRTLLAKDVVDGIQVLHDDALHGGEVFLRLHVVHLHLLVAVLGIEQDGTPLVADELPVYFLQLLHAGPPLMEVLNELLVAGGERHAQVGALLHVLLLHHVNATVELLFRQAFLNAGLLNHFLAPGVVTLQFSQCSIGNRGARLAAAVFLRVEPMAFVGQVTRPEFFLYLQSLGVVPLDDGAHVARHALLDGCLQCLVLREYALYVGVGLDGIHELLHLVTACHQLLRVHVGIVQRVGALGRTKRIVGTLSILCVVRTGNLRFGTFHGINGTDGFACNLS